ncbi:MAG TPA: YkgJ family cysteine cluster protein [bacterium]|nr:YkgJ family cysteine cluster protein [bacterium]
MKRWYSPDGVRFSCREGCAFCCRGEPGVVNVDTHERLKIAAHLGLEEKEFRRRYCRRVGLGAWSLVEHPNGDCVFITPENLCSIYAVRPKQCRTYPFWKSTLASRTTWEREGRECPGIGRGKLHTPADIAAYLRGEGDPS